MATTEERMQILKMVAEKKITAEEGAKLLSALEQVQTQLREASGEADAYAAAVAARAEVAALLSTGVPALVVIARAADVGLDASAVLKALLQQFGGKGGGKPDLAQGGGLIGAQADIIAALNQLIESSLRPAP